VLKEVRIGAYLIKQKLAGRKRYPLVLMLEPLFRCNLTCFGCGKIVYPDAILNKRLSVKECLDAVDECGAPMVAIPGGEPLIHKEIGEIVKGIVKRKKFVSLCTNALLLEKKLHLFEPSPYLFFSVHLDGLREHHDKSVCMEGGFAWHPRFTERVPDEVAAGDLQQPVSVMIEIGRKKSYTPICFNQNMYFIIDEHAALFAGIQNDAVSLWRDAWFNETQSFREAHTQMRKQPTIRSQEGPEFAVLEFDGYVK